MFHTSKFLFDIRVFLDYCAFGKCSGLAIFQNYVTILCFLGVKNGRRVEKALDQIEIVLNLHHPGQFVVFSNSKNKLPMVQLCHILLKLNHKIGRISQLFTPLNKHKCNRRYKNREREMLLICHTLFQGAVVGSQIQIFYTFHISFV